MPGSVFYPRSISGLHFLRSYRAIFFRFGSAFHANYGTLADAVGIPRDIVVSAYNWGQYAMLFLAPTGLVLVTLQMLHIPFNKWVKFVMPMIGCLLVIGAILLVVQVSLYSV